MASAAYACCPFAIWGVRISKRATKSASDSTLGHVRVLRDASGLVLLQSSSRGKRSPFDSRLDKIITVLWKCVVKSTDRNCTDSSPGLFGRHGTTESTADASLETNEDTTDKMMRIQVMPIRWHLIIERWESSRTDHVAIILTTLLKTE